jgi:hypothetical protein
MNPSLARDALRAEVDELLDQARALVTSRGAPGLRTIVAVIEGERDGQLATHRQLLTAVLEMAGAREPDPHAAAYDTAIYGLDAPPAEPAPASAAAPPAPALPPRPAPRQPPPRPAPLARSGTTRAQQTSSLAGLKQAAAEPAEPFEDADIPEHSAPERRINGPETRHVATGADDIDNEIPF